MIRWEQQCSWATQRPAWIILESVSPYYRGLKLMSLQNSEVPARLVAPSQALILLQIQVGEEIGWKEF